MLLPNSKFLQACQVLEVLGDDSSVILPRVPPGNKENEYFLVDNSKNISRRETGEKSVFWDDCGAWNGKNGSSPITYFIKIQGKIISIVKREGVLCFEKQINKKRTFTPLDPQPVDVIILHRSYSTLKRDPNYRRRVSWLEGKDRALVEYIGKFPGRENHGNRKNGSRDYIRTPAEVLQKIGQMSKNRNPANVFDEMLNMNESDMGVPRDIQQIRNKKCNEKKKDANIDCNTNNFADNIQQLQAMVLTNPFVHQVINCKSKVPSVVCYFPDQLTDIRRFCARDGGTVLGFDKTFNLSDIHVTVSVFKYLAVRRLDTDDHPIFFGPVFFHGNSHASIYHQFFSELSRHFTAEEQKHLILGSDDEKGMRCAMKSSFPFSTSFVCTRHLKQNINDYLTNSIGIEKSARLQILSEIFGESGIATERCEEVIKHRYAKLLASNDLTNTKFDEYSGKRILPILLENCSLSEGVRKQESKWTNNNCESANFLLKIKTEWKQLKLVDLIREVQNMVLARYREVRYALTGRGRLYLDGNFRHRRISFDSWCQKSPDERDKLFNNFLKDKGRLPGYSTSTDGKLTVQTTPSKGKKPNQVKRKRAEKSKSVKKMKM
ncbi:hypothetical protein FSP39_011012 [Pinctada imbricata]|uniref:MULE transposase domain-containing protein n=1 Tax=Pinctada imbricata TaxID=66713 RepID=A0AA88Y670_PINIB|nr:hypothetical protein FSP39_011012 [Pinctada imbricata]